MGTPRVVLAAGVVVGLLVGTLAPAYAADDRPPKVGRKNLPTVARVAQLYPVLEGGSRFTTRGGRQVLAHAADDCVGTSLVAMADRGTRVNYATADEPVPAEEDTPRVGGYRFASVAAAKAVMTALEEYAERCAGLHTDAEDHTAELTRLDDPPHGDQAVALRVDVTWPDDGDGAGGYGSLQLVVRDGRSLSETVVRRVEGTPDLDPALALSRVAWRRLR